MKKSIILLIVFTLVTGLLTGCGTGTASKNDSASAPSEKKTLKVGVTAGPHAEILEAVKKVAEKDGLNLEIVEFNDYMQPNIALNQGDLDVNSYQHLPFLENQVKDRKYELVNIAKTVIFPMGIYSKRVKAIGELKEGATVAIPNDPSNGGRALLLLEKAGLLKLKAGVGVNVTVADIIENAKNIKIKEIEAAQIPRSLDDVDAAAVNTNYAIVAGLLPTKDSIVLEDANSPYANVLVVRTKDKENPVFQRLIKAYHSPEVKKFIEESYKGSFVPAW